MYIVLLAYLLVGFGLFTIPVKLRKWNSIYVAILQISIFIFFMFQFPQIFNGKVISFNKEWIPELGINFGFRLDGLSLMFSLLITGVGTLVYLYAHRYMQSYTGTDKFFFYLTIFTGAMLGLVLSSNLIQLFIFWELTSVISFLLISFFNEKIKARKAAFQALVITAFGGLSLLAGIILIGSIVESYALSDWIARAEDIKQHKLYLPGLILILVGVFTKSAQFPFHFWLPGAMQAPTPVSAYLHSATMVKAGVFLLARLSPVLGGTTEWTHIIPFFGVLTMLTGAYFAATQTDIKAILAYTTISALGTMVLLLGIDTKLSVKAALLFLYVHAFYKAALFMIAGLIDKKAGTRNVNQLGKLIKYMPITFTITLLAALSMAGIPPMLGFLGKELIYEAKVQSPGIASMVLYIGIISNVLMVFISFLLLQKVFFGKKEAYVTKPNEKGVLLMVGPIVLVLLSIVLGLYPSLISKLIEPALNQIRIEKTFVELKLWHGFNDVLLLSIFTVLLGLVLLFLSLRFKSFLHYWKLINKKIFVFNFSQVFSNGLKYFITFSKLEARKVQHGYHRYYILSTIVFVTILLWVQMIVTGGYQVSNQFSFQPIYISGLVLIAIIAALFSVFSNSGTTTIIAMAVVGYGISLLYLYYSAVDLAITQILVETLTVIIFFAILQKLPNFARLSSNKIKIRDFFIALTFGSVMTLLTLKAINVQFHEPISKFFMENSYAKAFGKNVVNVILVDFRAFDTMGEVVVLVIASIGVYGLIKNKTI